MQFLKNKTLEMLLTIKMTNMSVIILLRAFLLMLYTQLYYNPANNHIPAIKYHFIKTYLHNNKTNDNKIKVMAK